MKTADPASSGSAEAMRDIPDLEALLAIPRPERRKSQHQVEALRRAAKAQALAKQALTKLHPDEYRSLFEQAKAKLAAELGPLPTENGSHP
jgi:hypothetical protein